MASADPQITIYIRPWCGSVMRAQRWFDQRDIPYTEIDISRVERLALRVVAISKDCSRCDGRRPRARRGGGGRGAGRP